MGKFFPQIFQAEVKHPCLRGQRRPGLRVTQGRFRHCGGGTVGFGDATTLVPRRVCGFGSNSSNFPCHSLFCSGKTAAGSGKGGSRADRQLGGKMRISMGVHSGGFAANFSHKMRGHCCRHGMSGFLASHTTHNQRLCPFEIEIGQRSGIRSYCWVIDGQSRGPVSIFSLGAAPVAHGDLLNY